MNATNKLLDKWWQACLPVSAVAAGKHLGVSGQSIANYRAGLSQAAPRVIAQMAFEIGEEPASWLALVEAERSRDADDRRTWAAVARRLATAAAVLLAVGFSGFPRDVQAGLNHSPVYALCELVERLHVALRRALARCRALFQGWDHARTSHVVGGLALRAA